MLNLVWKDIIIQKKTLVFCILYTFFILFAFQDMGSGAFAAGTTAITYILLLTACAYEDKNKSDIMINSLPVRRNEVVLSKYVSLYVYVAVSTIAYLLGTTLLLLLKVPIRIFPLSLESFIAALFAVSLLDSLYLPVFFKYGYIKSKLVNFALFFGIFALAGIFGSLFSGEARASWIQALAGTVENLPNTIITGGILGIILILQGVSYGLSIHFYKNREF